MFTKGITAVTKEIRFLEKHDHGDEHLLIVTFLLSNLRIFRVILDCF